MPPRERLIKLLNLQKISAATIKPAKENVFVMDDLVITCLLSNILDQISGVLWSPVTPTGTQDENITTDGIYDSKTKSQRSTLTILAAKLAMILKNSPKQAFTCKFNLDSGNTPASNWFTATKTISIFNPCKVISDSISIVIAI